MAQAPEGMGSEAHQVLKEMGARVRHYRELKGLSQEHLARAVDTSYTTINHIENGRRFSRLDTLERIGLALGVSLRHILGLRDDDGGGPNGIWGHSRWSEAA